MTEIKPNNFFQEYPMPQSEKETEDYMWTSYLIFLVLVILTVLVTNYFV